MPLLLALTGAAPSAVGQTLDGDPWWPDRGLDKDNYSDFYDDNRFDDVGDRDWYDRSYEDDDFRGRWWDRDVGVEWDDAEYQPGEGYPQTNWYEPTDWFEFERGLRYEDLGVWGQRDDARYRINADRFGPTYFGADPGRAQEPVYRYYTEDWYDDDGAFEDWWD